jgi:hypothetical protein
MKTLPRDQDAMEAELAQYAARALSAAANTAPRDDDDKDDTSLISIEERMTSFNDVAAQETLVYVRQGIQEFRSPLFHCNATAASSVSPSEKGDDDDDDAPVLENISIAVVEPHHHEALQNQNSHHCEWTDETLMLPHPEIVEHLPTETTPLIV